MRIEIGNVFEEPRRNMYELAIEYMSGDADSYETKRYTGSEEFLQPAIEWLLAFDVERKKNRYSQYPRGTVCGTQIPHQDLPGAYAFEGWAPYPWPADKPRCVEMEWPRDVSYDDAGPASLQSWALSFYDADGAKHTCKVHND